MKKYGFIDLDKNISKDEILNQWYHKVSFVAKKVKIFEKNDLVQELMLHLFEISEKFNLGRSSFNTFAWTCLKNKIRTLIKQSKRKGFLESENIFSWDEVDFDIDYNKAIGNLNQKQKYVLTALKEGYKKTEIASKLYVRESRITGLLKELRQKKIIKEMLFG